MLATLHLSPHEALVDCDGGFKPCHYQTLWGFSAHLSLPMDC